MKKSTKQPSLRRMGHEMGCDAVGDDVVVVAAAAAVVDLTGLVRLGFAYRPYSNLVDSDAS